MALLLLLPSERRLSSNINCPLRYLSRSVSNFLDANNDPVDDDDCVLHLSQRSQMPIILSLEMHCTTSQKVRITEIVNEILGESVYRCREKYIHLSSSSSSSSSNNNSSNSCCYCCCCRNPSQHPPQFTAFRV